MLTALEAKNKTAEAIYNKTKEELKIVENSINIAIEDGKYEVNIDFFPSDSMLDILRGMGYEVECGFYRNEETVRISWEE